MRPLLITLGIVIAYFVFAVALGCLLAGRDHAD